MYPSRWRFPVFYRKKSGWEPMISLWDLLCAGRRRSGRWKPAFVWRGSWQMRDTVPLPQVKWELATPLPARRWYRCCWDMILAEVTGVGAGLSSEGLVRKVETIRRGIAVNRPNPDDALDVLSKVGGLDLAGIAGAFLGGASAGIPVVIDGLISAAAALIAVRLCPACAEYLLASHVSAEPAGQMLLDALGQRAILHAGMCLGEGTGAVTLFPVLDLGLAVYEKMSSFSEIELEPYTDFKKEEAQCSRL